MQMRSLAAENPPPQSSIDRRIERERFDLPLALLVVFITAAVFSPVLHHQFIETWDDRGAILNNPDYNPARLASLTHYWKPGERGIFYVPVTYTLWGLLAMVSRRPPGFGPPFSPAAFYAANLISHALCAGLVFPVLRRLLPGRWPALAAALLFALHPIQVEAVSCAWGVYTPLSSAAGLFAIWQYLLYSDTQRERTDGPARQRWHYAAATAGFILALLIKPTAVVVPLIIGAIEIGLRGRKPRELLAPLGPWLMLAAAATLLNHLAVPAPTVYEPPPWDLPTVALDAIAFYLWKLVLPVHLMLVYGRSPAWLLDRPVVWLTCLAPLAIGAICWLVRRRTRWPLTALAVFVLGLLPVLGLVPFDFQPYSTVADHYLYLSMLGPAMLLGYLLWQPGPRKVASAIAFFILPLLAVLSVRQLRHWQDDWKLSAWNLEVNPKSRAAFGGFLYLLNNWQHKDPPGFVLPASRNCTLTTPELLRVGDLLLANSHPDLAAPAYRLAIARGVDDAQTYRKLAVALTQGGLLGQAIAACREALRRNPQDSQAKLLLAELIERTKPASTSPTTLPTTP